jgi:hypothetical protein
MKMRTQKRPPEAALNDFTERPNSVQLLSKIQRRPYYSKSLAVKLLENLANEEARMRFPNVPYLAHRTFRDDNANSLTQCVIQYIRLKGGQSERISNTGRRIDTRSTFENVLGQSRTIGGSHWIKGTGTNGSSDISATIAGRSVKIEVKIGRDIQSEVQKSYQKAVEQAGGIYVIASSFAGFYSWYNQAFKP